MKDDKRIVSSLDASQISADKIQIEPINTQTYVMLTMKVNLINQSFEVLTPSYVYVDFARNIERFGRVCYKSEKIITAQSSERFVKKLIRSGHESVLEHCNLTVKFITDRATANALVRHRHCAFSQESTHYIDYLIRDKLEIIKQAGFTDEQLLKEVTKILSIYLDNEQIAPSIRRALLPLCFKTELIMTTNLREWRHILKIRTAANCHPQMKELMLKLLDWFEETLPIIVPEFT